MGEQTRLICGNRAFALDSNQVLMPSVMTESSVVFTPFVDREGGGDGRRKVGQFSARISG